MAKMRFRKLANPFPFNGCVPSTVAHLAGTDPKGLAERARRLRSTWAGKPLLTKRNAGYIAFRDDAEQWARLAGLRIVEERRISGEYRTSRWGIDQVCFTKTVAALARELPKGAWVVLTKKHALALVDGVVYDWVRSPKLRVRKLYRVERVNAQEAAP